MDFRPPPLPSTPISEAASWNPLQHLSQSTEKRWAESCRPEFPEFTLPEDDERTKFEAKQYNRKDDPTNRMYTAPVSFSAPAAPFRKTVAIKSSEEIDIELATMEASKLMSKLPSIPKTLTSICPLEEILGTDDDGYKVGIASSLAAGKDSGSSAIICAAPESLILLTTIEVANAMVAIAPIFSEYYQVFVEHQCDGKLVAQITETSIDMILELLSSWGISSSIHRLRIAQVFNEWRTNPPKIVIPRESRQAKAFTASETYSITQQKASVLASEISFAAKATSLNIDQNFSHFKKLSLVPLTKAPSKSTTSVAISTKETSSMTSCLLQNESTRQSHDLSVKYRIPRDKILVNASLVPEKDVSESECIANRLSSSQTASDFEKTAATIRHFIESPLDSVFEPILQKDDSQLIDSKRTSGPQIVPKSNKLQLPSYDTSPNVYSRPNLPASRYIDASGQQSALVKLSAPNINAVGATEEFNSSRCGIGLDKSGDDTESNVANIIVQHSNEEPEEVSHAMTLPKMTRTSVKSHLSPKKARQNSPNTGQTLNRVLTPKIKADGQSSFQRPSSATHHIVWIDENEKVDDQMDTSCEKEIIPDETTRVLEAMTLKTPLTIYLNAADKNFRPTKSKYNAGLQLMPLRQATEGPDSKFDSKQRSAGLRFRERTTSASVSGVSASGVQFNPVSALFRSKRWKACSNYHLFTSKLKASKDLQRFARTATTPHFKIDFIDENSIIRCIESSKLFALHFVKAAKYDELGELQPQSLAEEDISTVSFFWTGLTE